MRPGRTFHLLIAFVMIAGVNPLVGIIMGSRSDWETMSHAADLLDELGVPNEVRVLSAHRAPDLLSEYAEAAEARGLEVILAAAGMAAHLPGVIAAKTALPVLGVPLAGGTLGGLDALLSIVQMPAGVPVATFAVGKAGAVNAAIFAVTILAKTHASHAEALKAFRRRQRDQCAKQVDPRSRP